MRYFFRRCIPEMDRILVVESGCRLAHQTSRLLTRAAQYLGRAVTVRERWRIQFLHCA
jgi:hypothetical protein